MSPGLREYAAMPCTCSVRCILIAQITLHIFEFAYFLNGFLLNIVGEASVSHNSTQKNEKNQPVPSSLRSILSAKPVHLLCCRNSRLQLKTNKWMIIFEHITKSDKPQCDHVILMKRRRSCCAQSFWAREAVLLVRNNAPRGSLQTRCLICRLCASGQVYRLLHSGSDSGGA